MLGKKRSHPSTSMMKTGIIDSKSQLLEQRSNQVMTLLQQQTDLIANADGLPTIRLDTDADLSVYNTPLLKKFSVDVNLIWSLAIALYEDTVKIWFRELVSPGLSSQLDVVQRQHASDPFACAFTYLSFGQRDLASEESKKNKDFQLAMYISHSEFKNVKDLVQEHINTLTAQGQWQAMSLFHKRCWYTVAGQLGYSDTDKFIVTERVSWQCTLGMYLWYGNRADETPSLARYNSAFDESVADIHHLKTTKYTASPDSSCLWYQLLQWWIGDASTAQIDTWPLDLVWLLNIYKPSSSIDSSYLLKWVEQLERMDQAELAIYAALFLPDAQQRVNNILRQCEWTDENKLLNVYHIPSKNVYLAKALHAHDEWDFVEEYKILLEGGLYEQAKMNLLCFVLPVYFKSDDASIEKCLSYTKAYPQGHDELIQHIQKTLTYLLNNDKNAETSQLLIEKLKQVPSKYRVRHTEELFKNLIEAILY
ncbi:hypothetical protein MFLAVUS_002426 [Mucor flavus]|uniref:Nuclear pore complex protein NUP96 C-terminal domain-containing protein n=1 Tax=Mucor flavus TaxID=439312 RepID=A0ABP9YQ80_9FUNG